MKALLMRGEASSDYVIIQAVFPFNLLVKTKIPDGSCVVDLGSIKTFT